MLHGRTEKGMVRSKKGQALQWRGCHYMLDNESKFQNHNQGKTGCTSKVIDSLLAKASGQHRVRLDVSGVRQLQDRVGVAHGASFFLGVNIYILCIV